jgi:hypothetical protein
MGVLDGLLPQLALRCKYLDKEEQVELERLQGVLKRRLAVLLEELDEDTMEERKPP